MTCPACGSAVCNVVDSRWHRPTKGTHRRVDCQNCLHRFTTIEIVLEEYTRLTAESAELSKIAQAVQRALANREQEDVTPAVDSNLRAKIKEVVRVGGGRKEESRPIAIKAETWKYEPPANVGFLSLMARTLEAVKQLESDWLNNGRSYEVKPDYVEDIRLRFNLDKLSVASAVKRAGLRIAEAPERGTG